MKSCEATGKNVKQAVENALLELKAAQEDVDIKVLSEGGFLKKARVLVSISEDALGKYEKREKLKKNLAKEEVADEDFAKEFMTQKIKSEQKAEKKEEKEVSKTEKKVAKAEQKVEKSEAKAEHKIRIIADDEISAPIKKEKKGSEHHEKKMTGEEFLQGVLNAMNLQGNIEVVEEEKIVRYNLSGEGLNDLIGHHGDCMLSLSYLMSMVCKSDNHKKIVLDVENYRQRREESLIILANRIANKVAKSGRYYKLEPMDASERKIIHTALQNDDRVTTLSKGEEPNRYLIVFPKEYRDNK